MKITKRMRTTIIVSVFMAVFLMTTASASTQTLSPGDIAIIQYRTDSTDGFSFVALVDIAANTVVNFTDNGWTGVALTSDENTWTWTAPCGGLTKGSVAERRVSGLDHDYGDQVIAYQGTASCPTFIYALSTTPWRTSGGISKSTSYLPIGLANGSTARDFDFHIDNGFYNIRFTRGTAAIIKSSIGNTANWDRGNSKKRPFQPQSYWTFEVLPGPPNPPTIEAANTTTPFLSVPTTGTGCVSGVISDPTDPATNSGIDFTIDDPDTPVDDLTVTVVSTPIPGKPFADPALNLTGTGSYRNLKITPRSVGYAEITVCVDDGSATDSYNLLYAASAASVTPTHSRFHTGACDASTAIAIDDDYMFVGNDEDQVIRLYTRSHSGLPYLGQFDFTDDLGLTDTDKHGVLREVDIEASTRVGDTIYWIGSHGNNKDGKCRPNRYRLFAADISGTGASANLSYVGRYDHLRTDLINWDNNGDHGKGAKYYGLEDSARCPGLPPTNIAGFNIEGLAMAPDSDTIAYVAFRAPISPPSDRTKALIVSVINFTSLLYSDGGTVGSAEFGDPIELDLGGRGIRSIERNDNNQYLIIAGPANATHDFQLYTWSGYASDALKLRSANLTALNASGSFESIVELPDTLDHTSVIQLLLDNGITDWYDDGQECKKLLTTNFQKFRSDWVTELITVNDDGGADYTSIQDAINNASAGNSIEVWNGTYDENVDVNKQLTIYSRDGADITIVQAATSSDYVFNVTADYVNINGFTITGATGSNKAGIYLRSGVDNCYIINNIATNNWAGIYLHSSNNNTLSNNNASYNDMAGIHLYNSSNNTLSNNNATNNSEGIRVYYSNNNTLSNNNANSNGGGIVLDSPGDNPSSNNTLFNNTALNNWNGILLEDTNNNTLNNNNVSNNHFNGIFLEHTSNNNLSNNTVLNNRYGIKLLESNNNNITNSTINNSGNYDFYLTYSSKNIATNTTFSTIYVFSSTLIIKNYLNVKVIDEGSNPIQKADVLVKDNENAIYASSDYGGRDPQTDSNGMCSGIVVTDRIYYGSSIANENTTNVSAKYVGVLEQCREVNMSSSHTEIFTLMAPQGGMGIAVLPRLSPVTAGSTVDLNVKIVSNENFDDVFYLYLTTDGLPSIYQADLSWFNWTETTVAIPAGGEAVIPLRADIPSGASGIKAFRAKVESTKWTTKAMDTGIFSIS